MAQKRVEVNVALDEAAVPRPRRLRPRRRSDFAHVPAAWLDVAQKLASPLLFGPPLCDELVAFVQHTFTEDEARLVRRLSGLTGKSAAELARSERMKREEAQALLEGLAQRKRAIGGYGPEGRKKYRLLPIMPGIFEMVLVGESPQTMSPWHRRFAELFETLYETGYIADHRGRPAPFVRFLPLESIAKVHPMALPSDRLEPVVERYKAFGVGHCQCRMTMAVVGRGCGKPIFNCVVMGEAAEEGVRAGWAKSLSKKEVLAVKAEAEANGMVSWLLNVESSKAQVSCSCCGCCCHAMRTISEHNVPGLVAPPHFVPQVDAAKCSYCGKCARSCPMKALAVDAKGKVYQRLAARCIGCGLCAVACDAKRAITMEPLPGYKGPPRTWLGFLLRTTPNRLWNAFGTWRRRRAAAD